MEFEFKAKLTSNIIIDVEAECMEDALDKIYNMSIADLIEKGYLTKPEFDNEECTLLAYNHAPRMEIC